MRLKLQDLALKYPRYIKVQTASERYKIKHRVTCEDEKVCEVDIVTLTDLETQRPKK